MNLIDSWCCCKSYDNITLFQQRRKFPRRVTVSRGELLEMSFDILAVLAKKCSEGKGLIIDPDWGYGSGTLFDPITGVHTHFGDDNGEDEEKQLASFIEGLYNILLFGVPNA